VAAQEQATVGAEVVLHLQGDLEVAILLVGDEDAAVTGNVLAADDGTLLDDPAPAGLVLALAAVPALGADVPALETFAVENRDETLLVGFGLVLVAGGGQAGRAQREACEEHGQENVVSSHGETPVGNATVTANALASMERTQSGVQGWLFLCR